MKQRVRELRGALRKQCDGKKAVIDLGTWWVELVSFIVLVAGFAFSISIQSAFMSYAVIFLFGLLAGRFLYYRRHGFPFYLIGMALLLGYVLGTRHGDWKLVMLFFLLGAAASYYAHAKGWMKNL